MIPHNIKKLSRPFTDGELKDNDHNTLKSLNLVKETPQICKGETFLTNKWINQCKITYFNGEEKSNENNREGNLPFVEYLFPQTSLSIIYVLSPLSYL